jgi:hypothetical protein
MTVKELMELLAKIDPDAEILLLTGSTKHIRDVVTFASSKKVYLTEQN